MVSVMVLSNIAIRTSGNKNNNIKNNKIITRNFDDFLLVFFKLDDWIAELSKEENRKYMIEQENLRSNECKIGSKIYDELLKTAGSLKLLEVVSERSK